MKTTTMNPSTTVLVPSFDAASWSAVGSLPVAVAATGAAQPVVALRERIAASGIDAGTVAPLRPSVRLRSDL